VLYALIVLGCALRIYNAIAHNPIDHLWSDPQRHWDHASKPLEPSPMSLFDPLVYQTWLSVIQRITMGIPGLIAVYAVALSVATPWFWYRFLREILASKTLALTGWAALALLPTWIGIYSYFMSETLLLPLIGLSLWMTCRARRKKTLASFLAMIVVWLITGLTRGIAIPLAGIACALVWFCHPQKLRTALYSIIILAATLTPLAIRNYAFLYLWAPHGNGWLTRIYAESGRREILLHLERDGARWEYGFTSPMVDERPFDFTNDWNDSLLSKWRECPAFLRSDWKSSRTGTVHVPVNLKHGSKDWETVLKQNALTGTARWKLRAENATYLFQGNSWPDNNREYFMGWLANLSRWLWIPFFLAVVIGCAWKWRCCLERPLLPLLIAAWFFFQAWLLISVNEGRYRKPLEGLLIAQTLVLIDSARRNRIKNQTPAAGSLEQP
jgi:4-amino-4-deoxy-L-arabinose transferase-like glycosyltransferase